MNHFIFDMIHVEIAFHSALLDSAFKLIPNSFLIFAVLYCEIKPFFIKFKITLDDGYFCQSFVAPSQAFDEGIFIINNFGLKCHFLLLSELVKDVPGNLGGD